MKPHLPSLLLLFSLNGPAQQATILDLKHYSKVFGEERNFRVFLPPEYEKETQKRYPVIYFFHGFGERFNNSTSRPGGYDTGYNGDNIASFVGRNDVIVVKWDGYNPRTPGENYRRPYNVTPVETTRQFPVYFPELVAHIDANFRTIPDRAHRAISGLSMGGFMSYWVSGKYPHLVGSSSNFMGSSEFTVGPKEFPVEYRHTEMHRNYAGLRTRIVLGTRDFIRWYHRRMNAIWDYTREHHEHEDFDWEHGTPGMAKTLAFHMAAFRNPLPKPSLWHHADVYPDFDVWDYSVSSDRRRRGFTLLENVSTSGFRSCVREWLPEGALLPEVTLRISTGPLYKPGQSHIVTDVNLDRGETRRESQTADGQGRLHFVLNGARHEVGIAAPGEPVLTVAGVFLPAGGWAVAGKPVRLRAALLNKGDRTVRGVTVTVTSPNPGVVIRQGKLRLGSLAAGSRATPAQELDLTVQDPHREVVKLVFHIAGVEIPVEVPLFPDVPPLADFRVADGVSLPVWQRAVQRVERTVGSGNGDGIADPGETIAIAIRDGEAYRLAELFAGDACVDLRSRASDMWGSYDNVGASAKISYPVISAQCPGGREVRFFARFQFPNKPEHILKEGVATVRIGR